MFEGVWMQSKVVSRRACSRFSATMLTALFSFFYATAGGGLAQSVSFGKTSDAGAAAPLPTTGIRSLDQAMVQQEAGNREAAHESYTEAITLLNAVVTRPLEPSVAKIARDRLAFAVMQLAVLDRGHGPTEKPLRFAYTLEQKYLNFEIRTASARFSQRQFNDGFEIYRVFTTRAGDDRKVGRPLDIYTAVSAAANGKFSQAQSILVKTMRRPYRFGNSLPLYLLGEVDRAIGRDVVAQEQFWRAINERECSALQYGLYGPQILAAGAIVNG